MPKSTNGGARLRNARREQDAPANKKDSDVHRGICEGTLAALLDRFRAVFTEPQLAGTRIHKADAREMNDLLVAFETEMREIIKNARVQQHGSRDPSTAVSVGADLSNVVPFRTK